MELLQATVSEFSYENFKVRIVEDVKDPLFCARDLAIALGIKNPTDILRGIPERYLRIVRVKTETRGIQTAKFVTEPDVFLILRSKRKEAVKFQEWISDVLLPKLRLTGEFSMGSEYTEMMKAKLAEAEKTITEQQELLVFKDHEIEEVSEELATTVDELEGRTKANDQLQKRNHALECNAIDDQYEYFFDAPAAPAARLTKKKQEHGTESMTGWGERERAQWERDEAQRKEDAAKREALSEANRLYWEKQSNPQPGTPEYDALVLEYDMELQDQYEQIFKAWGYTVSERPIRYEREMKKCRAWKIANGGLTEDWMRDAPLEHRRIFSRSSVAN